MKSGIWQKVLYIFNGLAAFILLLSYIIPYIPPRSFPLISVLSLSVPVLIIINVLFLLFWLVFFNKKWILSALVLLLGYQQFDALFKFSGTFPAESANSFSLMSYNVRLFNHYRWINQEGLPDKMGDFIKSERPDVLCFQDYHQDGKASLPDYPYQYESLKGKKTRSGLAVFTRFNIVNSGALDFPQSSNHAIFVDLQIKTDTVRVYNIHFQSLKISPEVETITQQDYEVLGQRISKAFVQQQDQLEILMKHIEKSPYKIVLAGDFNNTAFSYLYRKIRRAHFTDAFVQAGNGFGKTYHLSWFPLRIDFIMHDPHFKSLYFKTFTEEYSDHYPIYSVLEMVTPSVTTD